MRAIARARCASSEPVSGARSGFLRRISRIFRVSISIGLLAAAAIACRDAAGTAVSPPAAVTQAPVKPPARLTALADVQAAIGARLTGAVDQDPAFRSRREQADASALYQPGGNVPLWVDAAGQPADHSTEARALLAQAASEGLDPADYAVDRIDRLAAALRTRAALAADSAARPSDVADFDVAMSAGMLRYFRHLHLGRVDPRSIGFRLVVPAEGHDFATVLRTAIADRRIANASSDLAPPLAQYRALRGMLARYRSLAADTTMDTLAPPGPARKPGERVPGLPALHRRLVALGDLAADIPAPAVDTVYDGAIVEGVQRFQARHGLEPDGVLGRATQAALAVPLAWRARQIELALERLRWLPDLDRGRVIVLNIPMFQLWAWQLEPGERQPALGMRAIVGRALNTQTPVFVADMNHVIFRPYWNVPRSILLGEILPLVARQPGYVDTQEMEIVRGGGDQATTVAATGETLALLRQGVLRLRQRPGPRNALGLVKFVFPNDADVYMHGTPAQALFGRMRRDFSHGCVRVEDPVALAEWVLKDRPHWNRERIVEATAGPRSQRVDLTEPIRVILFYVTAVVMPADGTIHFADDIYRHDPRLDRALAAVRSRRPADR